MDADAVERAGTFFAISSMTAKIATAFGTGISLNVVAFFGFNPSGAAGVNGPEELWALSFAYAILPAVFFACALWLVWNYRLTPERQARLRALIERRNKRLAEAGVIPATVQGEHS